MSEFVFAPAARSDLLEIWDYYASEVGDVNLADRIREEILLEIHRVARMPGIGHLRRDLTKEALRFWRVHSFLIVYRFKAKPVQIVRVLHGARDVGAILGDESS